MFGIFCISSYRFLLMKGKMSCNMHNEVPPPILIQNIGAKNGTKNGTKVILQSSYKNSF